MNGGLQRRINGALIVSGLLGLGLTAYSAPISVGFVFGKGMRVLTFYWSHLPLWLLQMNLTMGNVGLMAMAMLCVLLLVAGKWPSRVVALLGAGWVVAFLVLSRPGGYWTDSIARFDMKPVFVVTSVQAVVILLLSVFALWEAVRLRREFREEADGRKTEGR